MKMSWKNFLPRTITWLEENIELNCLAGLNKMNINESQDKLYARIYDERYILFLHYTIMPRIWKAEIF